MGSVKRNVIHFKLARDQLGAPSRRVFVRGTERFLICGVLIRANRNLIQFSGM